MVPSFHIFLRTIPIYFNDKKKNIHMQSESENEKGSMGIKVMKRKTEAGGK